ncbi:MAG TPA: carboxypeptidase-like regulatory domain-containing protein [Acidobacteriaceae bacterium]
MKLLSLLRGSLALLAAFLFSAHLQAQSTGIRMVPATNVSAQYSGSISGHVYCADTSAPARFAQVTLTSVRTTDTRDFNGGVQTSSTTGLDGSFQIQNVRPGMYYVAATLPGYL